MKKRLSLLPAAALRAAAALPARAADPGTDCPRSAVATFPYRELG